VRAPSSSHSVPASSRRGNSCTTPPGSARRSAGGDCRKIFDGTAYGGAPTAGPAPPGKRRSPRSRSIPTLSCRARAKDAAAGAQLRTRSGWACAQAMNSSRSRGQSSRRYRAFEERLISRETLKELERDGTLPIAVDADFERFIAARRVLLSERLAATDVKAKGGLLPDVKTRAC
jgi:hypothetical protein